MGAPKSFELIGKGVLHTVLTSSAFSAWNELVATTVGTVLGCFLVLYGGYYYIIMNSHNNNYELYIQWNTQTKHSGLCGLLFNGGCTVY